MAILSLKNFKGDTNRRNILFNLYINFVDIEVNIYKI